MMSIPGLVVSGGYAAILAAWQATCAMVSGPPGIRVTGYGPMPPLADGR